MLLHATLIYDSIIYNIISIIITLYVLFGLYGKVRPGVLEYRTVQYNTIQYNTIPFSSAQLSSIQFITLHYITLRRIELGHIKSCHGILYCIVT